jgi:phosphopantetheinyl transferase
MHRAELRALAHELLRAELGATTVGRLCPRCGSSEHGRPYVVGAVVGPPARVSISYSTDLVAVAWANGPVGIDVEDDGPPVADTDRTEFSRLEALLKADADVPVQELRLPAGHVGWTAGEDVSWLLAGPAAPAAPAAPAG